MRPLEIVYWLKFASGFLAALVCLGYAIATLGTPLPKVPSDGGGSSLFFYSASIAIVVYAFSYYAIKAAFKGKVAKTSKLVTTGIGIYFLSWIVFYALLYTIFSSI